MTSHLSEEFFKAGAVQCGSFTLKSGLISPIYLDMRAAVCNPELLEQITEQILQKIKDVDFDLLCGVPYSAIPIATALSLTLKKPLLLRRKEQKNYGLKKMLDGTFTKGQKVLVIEDIVTTGQSVLATIEDLEDAGLQVHDVAILVDRDQGGREQLLKKGIRLHSLYTLHSLFDHLSKKSLINRNKMEEVKNYLDKVETKSA